MRVNIMKTSKTGKTSLDKKAVIELYEENNDALYRYAYRYLGDQDLAEECVADVFTSFLKRIQTDAPYDENYRAYLYRSAHNWIIDHYRKRKDDQSIDDLPIPDPSSDIEENLFRKQRIEKLKNALLRLPEEQRMVIELRFMENWPHEKVSNYLGKTVEATRALQYRSMIALRETLSVE